MKEQLNKVVDCFKHREYDELSVHYDADQSKKEHEDDEEVEISERQSQEGRKRPKQEEQRQDNVLEKITEFNFVNIAFSITMMTLAHVTSMMMKSPRSVTVFLLRNGMVL